MPKPTEVYVELILKSPYNASFETVVKLTTMWGMRIIESNTISNRAVISIKLSQFKKLFQLKPEKDKEFIFGGTTKFVEKSKVIDIKEPENGKESN
jgi:hypothetical protein